MKQYIIDKIFQTFQEEFSKPIIAYEEDDYCVECSHDWVKTDEWYECRHCHMIQPILVDSIDAPSQTNYIYLKYMPLTHFKSRLSQLQGKETKDIPTEIIDLCKDCKNYKEILSILKINKKPTYYKHKMKILNQIGQSIPLLTSQEEQRVIEIFKQRFPMKQNKNNIPYQFVLFKILTMIKRDDILPYIELTKNKTKLKKYEKIWTKV